MRTCSRNDHIQCESKNDSACKYYNKIISNKITLVKKKRLIYINLIKIFLTLITFNFSNRI